MLYPEFQITQVECNELIIKDITPAYSPQYPGGYGALNVDADRIVKIIVTLDFGRGQSFDIEAVYNQTLPDLVIKSEDIPFYSPADVPCNDCNPSPCGCEGCGDHSIIEANCHGTLVTFPSGCITVKFELFSQINESFPLVSEATRVIKMISTCHEDKLFAEVADKLTIKENCEDYDFNWSNDKRQEAMRDVMLAWTKLKILETNDKCDCECIAGRAKQINNLLKDIKFRK